MDSEVDQSWGRPLEQYVASYGISAHRERGVVPRETEEEAQTVKEAMYGHVISAHGSLPGIGDFLGANNITVPMLQRVLKLTRSPHQLHFFADPVFIGGCVRFLAQIRPNGVASPFSHELGYICFKVIAIGIGTWILKVTKNLDITVRDMEADTKTEPLLIFSGAVSSALQKAMLEVGGGGAIDWIMGWSKTRGHMNPERFLLPSDLRILLSLLWEDRKRYLRVLLTTYFPGLSGVMFVLWRYLDVKPATQASRPSQLMVIPFCDLLWRTMLVATEDQLKTMKYINNMVHHNKRADLWDDSPKYVDLEDSLTLLRAFNTRLSPGDLRLFKPLSLADAGVLLQFVTGSVQPGSEDLFPALFGRTIECIWRSIETGDLKLTDIIELTGGAFASLGEVIEPLKDSNQPNTTAIINPAAELERHDFLELLARLILILKPGDTESTFNQGMSQNTMFINNTSFLVGTLAKVVPAELVSDRFKHRVNDWSKMNYQLSMFELLGPSRAPKAYRILHRECTELWIDIAHWLGLASWAATLEPHTCSYPRCPYGRSVLPVEFICTRCHELSYCSAECQTRDWVSDYGEGSHRQLCKSSAGPPQLNGTHDLVVLRH